MTAAAGCLLSALLAPPASEPGVVSVRTEAAPDGRVAVVVVLGGPDVPATVRREGRRVIVEVAGGVPPLALPRPEAPVVDVAAEPSAEGPDRLVVEVEPPFDYETTRRGRELRLLVASRPAPDEMETLVQMLFPAEAGRLETAGPLLAEPSLPRLRLRPSVSALYAAGTNSFEEGPQPDEDSYWDVGPRVEALSGPLRVSYEAHVRGGSRYAPVNSTITHLVDAEADGRLAGDARLTGTYEFLRGRQQVNAVDPGGEYFYGLERFRKHRAGARARVPVGGATHFLVGGTWDDVRFDEPGAFTDYSAWGVQGGLRRDVGAATSLEALLTREKTYAASDPNVEDATADTASLSLTGEVRPMLHVNLMGGLGRYRSPGAPPAARELHDLVARVGVRKEITEATAVEVGYTRTRNVSAFEGNPTYRSDFLEARAHAPLRSLALAASAGFRRNGYPLDAEDLGAPRRDRVYGWALGLGLPLGRHAIAHVEYRWLRRDSNLPGLSSVAHGFLAQVDVTPRREGARP